MSDESREVGVGPHPEPWPEDPRLDPALLADGDRRNVVDRYRYWRRDAIVADLDARRHPFHVAVENWEHDLNIGTVVRNANAFLAAEVHIVGRRRWNRRGAMVTDRYQHVRHHATLEAFAGWAGDRPPAGDRHRQPAGRAADRHVRAPGACALLFGQEGPGLSPAARELAVAVLRDPPVRLDPLDQRGRRAGSRCTSGYDATDDDPPLPRRRARRDPGDRERGGRGVPRRDPGRPLARAVHAAGASWTPEIAAGVAFWGYEDDGELLGVMGIQPVADVDLIRHAYVQPAAQGPRRRRRAARPPAAPATRPILVGTWAAAGWAIGFYRRHGFVQVGPEEKTGSSGTYWTIPDRQIATSAVLSGGRGSAGG